MTLDEKRERYLALCHAMQTGVAYEMERHPQPTQPKHLRVGVNTAMVEHAALVDLLIRKGLLTRDEYFDMLLVAMEREVHLYEQRLAQEYGAKITLL